MRDMDAGEYRNGKACRHPMDPEKMPVTMIINELSKLFHIRMYEECEKLGIRSGYQHILFQLSHQEKLTQQELIKRTHFKAPTICVALQKMEADGYVIRESDANDARKAHFTLTEKGYALDESLRASIHRIDDLFVENLSEKDCDSLKSYLIKIRSGLLNEE